MRIGGHNLGCSVTNLYGLPDWYNLEDETTDIRKDKNGFKKLFDFVAQNGGNGNGAGGIAIWADPAGREGGRELANFIRKHGGRVDQSLEYDNPLHNDKCVVYMWYYRLAPEKNEVEATRAVRIPAKRPLSSLGRKTLVAKAKTSSRSVAGAARRFG